MPEIQRLLRNDSALLGTRDYDGNAELGIPVTAMQLI